MKSCVLILHFLITTIYAGPLLVPCPEPANPGYLYALLPNCQLLTAPSQKFEELQQYIGNVTDTSGACDVSVSSALQRPIAMTTSVMVLSEVEVPSLHILWRSGKDGKSRLVRIPDTAWSSKKMIKTELDSIGNSLLLPDTTGMKHDSCTLESGILKCYNMDHDASSSETKITRREFTVSASAITAEPNEFNIYVPSSSIASHVPLTSYTTPEGRVHLLITHVLKWLWSLSDSEERPHAFSVIRVPTQVSPASIPRFALPLASTSFGVSSAVCDRKTFDPPDCAHHFTSLSTSFTQCLIRAPLELLVGYFPRTLSDATRKRFLRQDVVIPKDENHDVEATGEAKDNNTIIIEPAPDAPIAVHTNVKVSQPPMENIIPILIIAAIFALMLILIIVFLLCLFCYHQRNHKTDQQKIVKEKIEKVETNTVRQNVATKSDIERLIAMINESRELNLSTAKQVKSLQSARMNANDRMNELDDHTAPKNSTSNRKTMEKPKDTSSQQQDPLDGSKGAEHPGKIKVRVTLQEKSQTQSRTPGGLETPNDSLQPTSQTPTMTQTPSQTADVSSYITTTSLNSTADTVVEQPKVKPQVYRMDHVCRDEPVVKKQVVPSDRQLRNAKPPAKDKEVISASYHREFSRHRKGKEVAYTMEQSKDIQRNNKTHGNSNRGRNQTSK